MDAVQFSPDQSVAAALQQGQAVSKVFNRHKTACVGCYLARFCTLKDVVRTYDLDLEGFLKELRHSIQMENSTLLGVKK